jgi:hypothetical protein
MSEFRRFESSGATQILASVFHDLGQIQNTMAKKRRAKKALDSRGDPHDPPPNTVPSPPHPSPVPVESLESPSGSRLATISERLERFKLDNRSSVSSIGESPMPAINATNVVVVNNAGGFAFFA